MVLLFGRWFYAAAIVAFGVENVIFAGAVKGLQLLPQWIPGHAVLAVLAGAVFIAAGVSIAIGKWMRPAGSAVAALYLLSILVLHAPRAVGTSYDVGYSTTVFESLTLCAIALVSAGTPPLAVTLGRFFFAISMVIFGIDHVIVDRFIASLIPGWIPWHMFWVYLTAVVFVAAGVSLAVKKFVWLSTTLLALMFFLWVVLLHAPRIAGQLRNSNEWDSGFVALAVCGGALIMGARFATKPK